jgi:hypothetical protein
MLGSDIGFPDVAVAVICAAVVDELGSGIGV